MLNVDQKEVYLRYKIQREKNNQNQITLFLKL